MHVEFSKRPVVGVLQRCVAESGPATAAALGPALGNTETGPSPFTTAQATTALAEMRTLRNR